MAKKAETEKLPTLEDTIGALLYIIVSQQQMLGLWHERIATLEKIVTKDFGYSDEDLDNLFTSEEKDGMKKFFNDLREAIIKDKGTNASVKAMMKQLGY